MPNDVGGGLIWLVGTVLVALTVYVSTRKRDKGTHEIEGRRTDIDRDELEKSMLQLAAEKFAELNKVNEEEIRQLKKERDESDKILRQERRECQDQIDAVAQDASNRIKTIEDESDRREKRYLQRIMKLEDRLSNGGIP